MKKSNATACGKVLLTGDHSVVYGFPALAARIDLAVLVSVQRANTNGLFINSDYQDASGIVTRAISLLSDWPHWHIGIKSHVLSGSGLGSSAALGVSTLKAIAKQTNQKLSMSSLYKLSLECEKQAHGNPSGVDSAAVLYGGVIRFRKTDGVTRIALKPKINVVLINSGLPSETTKQMVELVQQNRQSNKKATENTLHKIGEISDKMYQKLKDGENINQYIDENGKLLEKLGVVGKRAQLLSQRLRKEKVSVKVTGAGGIAQGSGMLLCMDQDLEKVHQIAGKFGFDSFTVTLGE